MSKKTKAPHGADTAPTLPTPDDLLAAALGYAKQGFRVHPLRPMTKVPRLAAWQDKATTDADTIAKWWGKWPTSNVGIATGRQSNLWVLDVDLGSHRDEAQETIGMLVERGYMADTMTVTTPSGGVHYWHAWPKGKGEWTNSGGDLIRKRGGVDVRADGGQVAVAPSVISHDNKGVPYPGGPRAYVNKTRELTRPPKWLSAMTRQATAPVALPSVEYDPDGLSERDRGRIASYVETVIAAIADELDALRHDSVAQWDNEVFVKAQRLVDIANAPWSPLTLDGVRAILLKHAPTDEGFPQERVLAKLSSAVKRATAVLPLPIRPEPELATFDFPKDLRPDPGTFFDNKIGLLAEQLAQAVGDDLAVALDGTVWVYGGGVYTKRDDEIDRRVVRALGDRFRPGHAATIRTVITKGGNLPLVMGGPEGRYINTTTGMLDWRTGKLHEHDAAYLSTVQLPIAYDEAARCPTFDAWLDEIVDADTVALIWELIGYLVMSGNPLHKAVLFVGNGRNGKGTLLRVITAMLGKPNTSSLSLTDITDGKFELAGLFGKLANIAGDIEARTLTHTAKFKAVTGEDSILVQHKFGHPFEYTPWAVPLFSANQLWQSSDNTDGYLDRWLVVPFPRKLEQRGLFDESTLIVEAPGILNKAVASLRSLMARGDFELGGHAADVKRIFERESDVVKTWLEDDERIVMHEAGNTILRTGRTDLYRRYTAWSQDSGYQPLNAGNFYRRLERMGYTSARSNAQRVVMGVRLDMLPMPIFATPAPTDD